MPVSIHDQVTQKRIEISWKEFEKEYLNEEKPYSDFIINLVSPYESAGVLEDKMNDYRSIGAKTVWLIYVKQKSVHVYTGKCLECMVVHTGNMVCSAICGKNKLSINTAAIFSAITKSYLEESV